MEPTPTPETIRRVDRALRNARLAGLATMFFLGMWAQHFVPMVHWGVWLGLATVITLVTGILILRAP